MNCEAIYIGVFAFRFIWIMLNSEVVVLNAEYAFKPRNLTALTSALRSWVQSKQCSSACTVGKYGLSSLRRGNLTDSGSEGWNEHPTWTRHVIGTFIVPLTLWVQSLWWEISENCRPFDWLATNRHIPSNKPENIEDPFFSLRTRPETDFPCPFHP